MPTVSRYPTPLGFHEIDVRALKRDGLLVPGVKAVIRKRYGGRVIRAAVVSAQLDDEALILADGRSTFAQLTYTYPHLGGRRTWFSCPRCGDRVAILYGSPFACRPCHRITYASQRDGLRGRALRRAQGLRIRLGGTGSMLDPIPPRPWGMWNRTYRRLVEQGLAADQRSLVGATAILERWRATAAYRRALVKPDRRLLRAGGYQDDGFGEPDNAVAVLDEPDGQCA